MSNEKPLLLVIRLGDPGQISLVDDMYAGLLDMIKTRFTIKEKRSLVVATEFIAHAEPKAVFVIDGGLSWFENKVLRVQLSHYVRARRRYCPGRSPE